jgi:hypothetical protein
VQRQRQGQRGAAASSGVQRVAWDSGWGWMRERRSLADLWPSCPWQVLEACRDASVSPQLRTARPARAPASQGSTAPRAARQHGVSERTSQGRALLLLLLLLLIILRVHTRFTPPWRPKGVAFWAWVHLPVLWLICRRLVLVHYPSVVFIICPSGAARPSGSAVLCLQGNAPGLGWLGWRRREIDTILRLFLALLPPRYRRLVSPPLAARRLTATITHATCRMPHLPALPHLPATPTCHTCHMPCHSPSSSFAQTRTARRLLIPPNANVRVNANPALISRWPLTAVALSLAHLGRPRLAWCPRRPRPRPFLPHSPPSAFRVFAALQLRTSLTRPPTHCPLPIAHYPLHIIAYVASR